LRNPLVPPCSPTRTPRRPCAPFTLLFASRWLQLPLYLGLIVAQCVYVVQFMRELSLLLIEIQQFDETINMLSYSPAHAQRE
jgi:uncharacterized membrane protein YqhA